MDEDNDQRGVPSLQRHQNETDKGRLVVANRQSNFGLSREELTQGVGRNRGWPEGLLEGSQQPLFLGAARQPRSLPFNETASYLPHNVLPATVPSQQDDFTRPLLQDEERQTLQQMAHQDRSAVAGDGGENGQTPDSTQHLENGLPISRRPLQLYRRALSPINRRLPEPFKVNCLVILSFLFNCALLFSNQIIHITGDGRNNNSDGNGNGNNDDNGYSMKHLCAAHLSQVKVQEVEKPNTGYSNTLDWIVHGPGALIKAPSNLQTCTWDSDFGQLYALIAAREFMRIPDASWNNLQRPLQDLDDVCKWSRVQCNAKKQISGLTLNNDSLDGTMPKELMGLIHLEQLQVLTNVKLRGTIPTEIAQLTRLQDFELHGTSIAGTVPTQLGKIKALRTVKFEDTELTGTMPQSICDLTTGGELSVLEASCQKLTCPCCTKCS